MPTLTDIEEQQRAVLDLLRDEHDLRRLLETRQARLTSMRPEDPARPELEAATSALKTLVCEQQQAVADAKAKLQGDAAAVAGVLAARVALPMYELLVRTAAQAVLIRGQQAEDGSHFCCCRNCWEC